MWTALISAEAVVYTEVLWCQKVLNRHDGGEEKKNTLQ